MYISFVQFLFSSDLPLQGAMLLQYFNLIAFLFIGRRIIGEIQNRGWLLPEAVSTGFGQNLDLCFETYSA